MQESSNRHIGDMVFDVLMEIPGFEEEAQRLIEGDWRTGGHLFQNFAEPLIDQLPFEATPPPGGELSFHYLEQRIMSKIDVRDSPWLWSYRQMVGALLKPSEVRFALNAIQNGTK